MRNYILLTLFFACLQVFGQLYQPVFPDLQGNVLRNEIISKYKPQFVLNYSDARDTMYGKIYNVNDSVSCIYTGHRLHLPDGLDPSAFFYMNGSVDGINAEHVFPQSKGANEDNGNAHSDLHHIFPVRARVNTGRDNFPFREIPDNETTSWYYENQILLQPPISNIELCSEGINGAFEPLEKQKGNIARAMFYFYMMYQSEADNADLDFFESQRSTLCDWHFSDPVDSLEWMRTFLISKYQDDKPNPFILDCSLAARTFCPQIMQNCLAASSTENLLTFGEFSIFPNPASDWINVDFSTEKATGIQFNFYDAFGRKVFSSEKMRAVSGKNIVRIPTVGSGFIILEANIFEAKSVSKIRKKVFLNKKNR